MRELRDLFGAVPDGRDPSGYRNHRGERPLHRLRVVRQHLPVRRLRPRLPVILSSGFSEEEVGDTLRAEGLEGFLQKPYRLKDLERTVREVLGA